jgi:hypothetical protein
MSDQSPVADAVSEANRRGLPRRWIEGTFFVALWMGGGWALELDANSYLLAGIPLTILFQSLIRRAPLRALWVDGAPAFQARGLAIAAALAISPCISFLSAAGAKQWIIVGWMASAIVGSIAAGYALAHFRRQTLRPFLLCQLTAGSIGIALAVAARFASQLQLPPRPLRGLQDFSLYFPVCFILEEVSFRGALDSHLYQRGDRFPFASALLGSVLWGVWHLPILPAQSQSVGVAIALAVSHSVIGVPLAIYWRKSGNLVVTAFAHAMIDAVRNALRLTG